MLVEDFVLIDAVSALHGVSILRAIFRTFLWKQLERRRRRKITRSCTYESSQDDTEGQDRRDSVI